MRPTTIVKYHELRELFCGDCNLSQDGRSVCTEEMNLRCVESCLYLATTYSDISEGKFYA